jgi:hypothetical protein
MPEPKKQRAPRLAAVPEPETIPESTPSASEFDPSFAHRMREILATGLTPASALELLTKLIAEVPSLSKGSIDQIKVLDKLINTARAMMETKLKSDEAAAIAARLDDLEERIDEQMLRESGSSEPLREVWNGNRGEQ